MADRSKIEWTDASWNPIRARNKATGKVGWHCEHASEGCRNCYAEKQINKPFGTGLPFKPGHRNDVEIFLDDVMLLQPLKRNWKQPRKVFVCSMTDLFADFVPDEWIDRIFAVMALSPRHTFQVLTKRSARMRAYLSDPKVARRIYELACDLAVWCMADVVLIAPGVDARCAPPGPRVYLDTWPLPNVITMVSAEDQERADERITDLLATPAVLRGVSLEPLIGLIDLTRIDHDGDVLNALSAKPGMIPHFAPRPLVRLDWVIVGGESGHGARPMHPDWARSLRDQCVAAGVPFFFKQWGEWAPGECAPSYPPTRSERVAWWFADEWRFGSLTPKASEEMHRDDEPDVYRFGKKGFGRLLDGREWNEMPAGHRADQATAGTGA